MTLVHLCILSLTTHFARTSFNLQKPASYLACRFYNTFFDIFRPSCYNIYITFLKGEFFPMLNYDAFSQTRKSISQRIGDYILREYADEHKEKPVETIPSIARSMLLKGCSYEEVKAEVIRLNSTRTRQFPLDELEKMARRLGKL